MSSRTVIIHAAGHGNRWTAPYPKQLIEINGEKIIRNITRRVIQRGCIPIVVTHNLDIIHEFRDSPEVDILIPENNHLHSDTLWSTRKVWGDGGDPTIHLFGDVLYQKETLDYFFSQPFDPFTFVGNDSQLFGFGFTDYQNILDELREFREVAGDYWDGNLCFFYLSMLGCLPHGHNPLIELHQSMGSDGREFYHMLNHKFPDRPEYCPWTFDIDCDQEYEDWMPRIRDAMGSKTWPDPWEQR